MRDIKLRYVFKRREDGHLYTIICSIDSLEGRGDDHVGPMFLIEDWELVGRDLFTGRIDSFEMEIYEGDILGDGEEERNGIVVWHNGSFMISSQGVLWSFEDGLSLGDEVLGNIHENPELIP